MGTMGGCETQNHSMAPLVDWAMVNGVHVLLYSSDPEADRAFFRDVLEFRRPERQFR